MEIGHRYIIGIVQQEPQIHLQYQEYLGWEVKDTILILEVRDVTGIHNFMGTICSTLCFTVNILVRYKTEDWECLFPMDVLDWILIMQNGYMRIYRQEQRW